MHATRRAILSGAAALPRPRSRIVVDRAFAGDPEGLVALAHQALPPKAKVTLVTTSALDPELATVDGRPAGATAAEGRVAALGLIARVGLRSLPPVVAEAETFGDGGSDAARANAAEAMRANFVKLAGASGWGDESLASLTAGSSDGETWRDQPARRIGENGPYVPPIAGCTVRVDERLDARLTLADLAARLRMQAMGGERK